MSKLNVDQKTIFELFSDKRADFLIPDYQRPYAWDEEHCQTLWEDLFYFSFPDNNKDKFDDNKDEYFLGSIVTYKNDKELSEIIDGQQRLTTILLLLRAFYDRFEHMKDNESIAIRKKIESCIWKTNTFGEADKDKLKINSEVATDEDKEEFLNLLKNGTIDNKSKSRYVANYRFFEKKIEDFKSDYPTYFPYLPARILGNSILLPIEADSQDTALRIFSTLNDRGLPLSDADIFKAQFYKYYGAQGKKDWFIDRWKDLEAITSRIFSPIVGTPMDELFTRYMYFLRAKEGNKSTTTDALRKFFEKDKYKYLNNPETITNLERLAKFWDDVNSQNEAVFDKETLKLLFVLNAAPNGMWLHLVSAWFLTYADKDGNLEVESFNKFLKKITGFIFTYAITNPGVNALRTPAYEELINIIRKQEVSFSKYKFNRDKTQSIFSNYVFTNSRNVTRSLITWYAYSFKEQTLLNLNDSYQLEHIYSKKRHELDDDLSNPNLIESLGNKILLERKINIQASDYRFEDKKDIYSGTKRRGSYKEKSKIFEITKLIEKDEFNENQILKREEEIFNKYFSFLDSENLLEE